jgi:hypothetical protein
VFADVAHGLVRAVVLDEKFGVPDQDLADVVGGGAVRRGFAAQRGGQFGDARFRAVRGKDQILQFTGNTVRPKCMWVRGYVGRIRCAPSMTVIWSAG